MYKEHIINVSQLDALYSQFELNNNNEYKYWLCVIEETRGHYVFGINYVEFYDENNNKIDYNINQMTPAYPHYHQSTPRVFHFQ